MKKLLTIVAMLITMMCGSIFLVSCSKNYKKMSLVVEYCVSEKNADGKWIVGEWTSVDSGEFDYYISDTDSTRLHMRVKVKGTSKKVSSLYISQSASSSVIPETRAVKPNEAFELIVNTIGRAEFIITPSNGGEDKAVSFGVNVYRELSSISQNEQCIPAAVIGASVKLENLNNLIKYEPVGETNQTGVNFSILGVGTLINDGNKNLIARTFVPNTDYVVKDSGQIVEHFSNSNRNIKLSTAQGYLTLDVAYGYSLASTNNVVHLQATSKYNKDITTDVYVYIVENFNANSLLVSYSPDVKLNNGFVPTDKAEAMPVPDAYEKSVDIYNSNIGTGLTRDTYNHIDVYTYTNASIYSYESNPGIALRVYINGERYYYDFDNEDELSESDKLKKYQDQLRNFGIQVSPITREENGVIKLVGLKFETNPTALTTINTYNIHLELDFTAFDFSASGKSPTDELNKDFIIKVQDLASGFSINGKSYNDNVDKVQEVMNSEVSTITGYDSTKPAKLYTSYSSEELGMELNIYAIPNNAINDNVYVGFYDSINNVNGKLITGNNLALGSNGNEAKLQLRQMGNYGMPMNEYGEYVVDFAQKQKLTYLKFNELANIEGVKEVVMVCRVQSTPDTFGDKPVAEEYITFVSKIKVVGSIDDVLVYKDSVNTPSYDTFTDKYLATATNNEAYINFSSVAGEIDYSEIVIYSLSGNIKFLNKNGEWKDRLTASDLSYISNGQGMVLYRLYLKTEYECKDSLIISSSNGVNKKFDYEFVNIVSNTSNIKIDYDETYINTFDVIDKVDIKGTTNGGAIDLRYLALQSGEKVQFVAYGDNKTNTIKRITATSLKVGHTEYSRIINFDNNDNEEDDIVRYMQLNALPTYNSGAILEPNDDGRFFFDVEANSVGFTSILLVKVDFYVRSNGKIELQSKYFLYEVAVYTPASRLTITAEGGKDKITYINENYPNVAKVEFNIGLNSATQTILFSSSDLNNQINLSYNGDNGVKSIYGIEIIDNFSHYNEYFEIFGVKQNGQNLFLNSDRKFIIKALQSLEALQKNEGVNSINFDVVIHQFGEEVVTTKENVVVYFADYNKSENIIVASGVDRYNNVYLSLAGGDASCQIEAYASNASGNVTYKELGFKLYQIDTKTNFKSYYNGEDLKVTYDENADIFEIVAKNKGGLYQLELYAKDAGSEPYLINITVSDGQTEATAYLIKSLDDFKVLKNNTSGKFYKLWQDINISSLSTDWWLSDRVFEGTLDGAMTISDPQTGLTISRRYSLTGLNILTTSGIGIDDAKNFGLFNRVTGTIKNVIFSGAKIDIELTGQNTASNAIVNIGVITGVNSGIIENCSVNIINSIIGFRNTASNTTYNIGLMAGLNLANSEDNGKIVYNPINTGSNHSRLVDVGNNAGKLTINVDMGNSNFAQNTNINIGGVVGQNASKIVDVEGNQNTYLSSVSANYYDKSSDDIKNEIKVVVNIEVNVGYNATHAPMNINAVNVGAVAGLNAGNISNIAVSGSIVANDKANIGGIAGLNTGAIYEVANYGGYIKGDALINGYKDINGNTLVYHSYNQDIANTTNQEQNVGGIVGYNNKGVVDNVRVLFITLATEEVSIEASRTLIQGVGNVGGIIGKATNTQLTHAYIENFVEDDDVNNLNYNIIGIVNTIEVQDAEPIKNGANVAGLIACVADITEVVGGETVSKPSSVKVAFVQADFNVDGCTFYEFGKGLTYESVPTYEYVYFIGDVLSSDATTEKNAHNSIKDGFVYIVKNVVIVTKVPNGQTGEDTVTITKETVEIGVDGIDTIDAEPAVADAIYWVKNAENEVNSGRPYLMYKKEGVVYYTLTIRPTEIIVNVDRDYFDENAPYVLLKEEPTDWGANWIEYYEYDLENKTYIRLSGIQAPEFEKNKYYALVNGNLAIKYDDGIYIQYVDDNNTAGTTEDDRIVATAIVYYVENGNNTYKLVSDDNVKGLIEKTILPNIGGVDGKYSAGIVSGSGIATLTDGGSTITFNGVGRVELKFVSVFDRTKTDTVVIFVENPLHDDVFSISASAGLNDKNDDSTSYDTRSGINSLLSLGLIAVNGQIFDSSKTYMTATYGAGTALITTVETDEITGQDTVKTETVTVADVTNYFSLSAITNMVGTGKYKLGQFNVVAKDLENEYSYLQIPVTINVYLNLQEYYINGVKLSELVNKEALLATKTIIITIYNKATNLTVSSDVKAESGEDVDIEAKLTTGYINTTISYNSIKIDTDNIRGTQGNKVVLNIIGQDTIDLVMTAKNENAIKLLEQAKSNSALDNFSIWYLFDTVVTYELFPNEENPLGYIYKINLRLKDEYRNLNLEGFSEREWIFNLNISASENSSLTKDIEVAFVPQQLINLRLENYSHLIAGVGANGTSTEAEFVSNQTESSLIVPGQSGLVKIFAEYNYSYFENIAITSSIQNIDGKEYFIRFQQMVYNLDRGVYESYAGITADGQTLGLKKVSYKQDGKYFYDGVLFVRTILDEFVGVRKIFTLTVNANTYDLNGNVINISRTKTVISQYRPGVYLSVDNATSTTINSAEGEKQAYIVEQYSSVSTIVARVYGYEFNVQPSVYAVGLNGEILGTEDVAIARQGDIAVDNTGAYVIRYTLSVNILTPFKIKMKMSLIDNSNAIHSPEKELLFYPVEYMVDNVYVKGEANGDLNIAVNSSRVLELIFNTKSTTNAKRNDINTKINALDYLDLFYINQVNANGQDFEKSLKEYLNSTNTNFTIKQNSKGMYYIEALKKLNPLMVNFELWYGYDLNYSTDENDNNENYGKVIFSTERTEVCTEKLTHSFRLVLTMQTSEDAPQPIENADDLMTMAEGENYILMNDITLENWVPLNTQIASLDGNGKRINIVSFNISVESTVNVGLFGTIGANTILKNIVLNIGTLTNNLGGASHALYIKDDNTANVKVNFGLIAGVNQGLIYNCEVLSVNTIKSVEVVIGTNYELTFGALVGVNEGNITNSRVGTEYFEELTYVNNTANSSIIQCGRISFMSQGIMAGFVGENKAGCTISSCFVANTSIENTKVGNDDVNRTAGFVATNAGTIAYSYVKGLEKNILTTKSTTNSPTGGTECLILASGNGNVAGFAYLNNGTIHDCYSNTICRSNSSGAAGFVYNTLEGNVYQCYSATKVESGNTNTALATELPFIGVGVDKAEAQLLLSNEDVTNCYYLDDGTEYDSNYVLPDGVSRPKGLTLENFAISSNLNNFSFISNNTSEQQLSGVWTYSTAVDANRSTYSLSYTALPELTSANTIARSLRYLPTDNQWVDAGHDSSEDKYVLEVAGYELGSKINPYIIRNAEEYHSVFVNPDRKTAEDNINYMVGYVRFVDDVSFDIDGDYVNVETRSEFILGDRNDDEKTRPSLTVIDGNGMTISDVVINYTKDETGKLGLFGEVYNSVIKGLNIEYRALTNSSGEDLVGSSMASYVGGIAGTAHNTYLIDLNLSGSVTLRANNVVGGVVGLITGENSGLHNITTNLNAQAGSYNTEFAQSTEYSPEIGVSTLSYAGGIAGIADIGNATNDTNNFNLNKLTTNDVYVRADRAGGIAGYLGENINANRLTYTISNASQVFGNVVAGAIVGDNYANIQLSQANSGDIETQYQYDKKFAEYIKTPEIVAIDNTSGAYGNLSVVTGAGVVGGFVGINNGGKISNSLTKAHIGNNDQFNRGIMVAGGFAGQTYGGDFEYVYAQNYIDLIHTFVDSDKQSHEYRTDISGGIIGEAKYSQSKSYSAGVGLNNVVSANWYDKNELINIDTSNPKEYLVGRVDGGVSLQQKSNEAGSHPIIEFGTFNVGDKTNELIKGKIANNYLSAYCQGYQMEDLYYIATDNESEGNSTQLDTFNTLFATWPEAYWLKDYTKFMPNLKLDDSTGYIEIANKKDVELMKMMPDRNFILVEDVPIDIDDSNYVVDSEFRGVLIAGLNDSGSGYHKFNITLKADRGRDAGAGFFKQTSGARIANVIFDYNSDTGLTLGGTGDYSMVGGVSAQDFGSRFEQIEVNGNIKTDNATVSNLGSIVGVGNRTKILSNTSDVDYIVDTSNISNIGGLVGSINGFSDEEDENGVQKNPFDGLISLSKYHGAMTIESKVGINVGGIAGSAQYTRISACEVVDEVQNKDGNKIEYKALEFKLSSTNGTNNVGGIIGDYDHCSISASNANIIVLDNEVGNKERTNVTYNVGGIVGKISNNNNNDGINKSYSKLTYKLIKTSSAFIGGSVGSQSAVNSVLIDSVVSQIFVNIDIDGAPQEGDNIIGKIVLGGIVALASGNYISQPNEEIGYSTKINNSMAIINADIAYNHTLFGGGLIGQATGSYSIDNSASTGYIWANNEKDKHFISNPTLTILGGLVGLSGEENSHIIEAINTNQAISNSYTTLTLSTANVYQGTQVDENDKTNEISHTVYTNGVIGKFDNLNKILTKGVLYSSDYTLALEEGNLNGNKFDNEPQNVTANFLINNNSTLRPQVENSEYDIKGYIGEGWIWGSSSGEAQHLPFPLKVKDILKSMGILELNEGTTIKVAESHKGQSYYPNIITTDKFGNFDQSKGTDKYYLPYYLLREDVSVLNINGDLYGVLLGSNNVLTSDTTLFDEIKEHSAISNLTFKLTNKFTGNGAVALTNNGTVFMVGVQYENLSTSENFGGIVNTNKGTISYCYNIGNASKDGAGLVSENSENASIVNSYFTGSFNAGEKGFGLVKANEGYVANSYSAGLANKVIGENKGKKGRYKDVKYDYYANYVTEKDWTTWEKLGVEGLSTIELQAVENGEKLTTDSAQLKGWKVYSMHNWDDIITLTSENVTTTYNYGYPIHNINQLTFINVTNPIDVRLKPTGNGTFDEAPYINGLYSLDLVQGKLVKHEQGQVGGENVTRYYDNFSFLINNLGVLSLINEIDNTAGKYFELEVDMTMPDNATSATYKECGSRLLSDWKGIGTEGNPFKGVFTTTSNDCRYEDILRTNVYTLDTGLGIDDEGNDIKFAIDSKVVKNTNPKVIKNLTGGPLFNYVSDGEYTVREGAYDKPVTTGAFITGVDLKNSQVTSAPLINFVVDDSKADKLVTVYNVNIVESVIAKGSTISGFVNTVEENATLHIYSIKNAEIVINGYDETTDTWATTVAGLINENKGTINIRNSFGKVEIEEGVNLTAETAEDENEDTVNKITFEVGKTANARGIINSNNGTINIDKSFNSNEFIFNSGASTNVSGLIGVNGSGEQNDTKVGIINIKESFTTNRITVAPSKEETANVATPASVSGMINTNNANSTINIYNSFQNNENMFEVVNSTKVAGIINVNNGIFATDAAFTTHNVTIKSAEAAGTTTGNTTNSGDVAGVAYNNGENANINGENSFTNIKITVESINGRKVAGFVYDNAGNITFTKISLELTSASGDMGNKQNNAKSISGLANTNSGNIISGGQTQTLADETSPNSTITINPIGTAETEFIAGLVGEMNDGKVAGFNVKFNSNLVDAFNAKVFGGAVAYLNGGQLGLRKTTDGQGEDKTIEITLATATTDLFGGVVAVVGKEDKDGENPSITNLKVISTQSQISVKASKDNESGAYGLIIGEYLKAVDLDEIYYTLEGALTFEVEEGVNVGAIIGHSQNGVFAFKNTRTNVATVTVEGFKNVGGFIGKYTGEESLSFAGGAEYAWAIGGKEGASSFAEIEFAELAELDIYSGLVEIEAENFGGLIGYWDSDADLQVETVFVTGKETAALLVNANPVLRKSSDGVMKNIEKTMGYNIVISNIGGVVGNSTASIINAKNEAIIGVELNDKANGNAENNGLNPISGTKLGNIDENAKINDIMQFMYVGGVVGCLDMQDKGETSLSVENCLNHGCVYGMYAVGGLVGGCIAEPTSYVEIEETVDKTQKGEETETTKTQDIVIMGLVDVGGIIGRAHGGLKFEGYFISDENNKKVIKTIIDIDNIIGIANVGGVVGNAFTADIQDVIVGNKDKKTINNIIGNLNVGGVIGFAQSQYVGSGIHLIQGAKVVNTTVIGSVFDYKYPALSGSAEYEAYYYLPTNIGGVIGQATAPVSFKDVDTEAYVRTDENFKVDEKEECTVNATFNYMGNVGVVGGKYYDSNSFDEHLKGYYPQSKSVDDRTTRKQYYEVNSGIGGFAGSLVGKMTGDVYSKENSPQFYECNINGDVYAYYGINVGGAIGYLGCDPQVVQLPTLASTKSYVNVAGKIFVGGYIGKTAGFGSIQGYEFFGSYVAGTPSNINVQQYTETIKNEDGTTDVENKVLSGTCIGGVIGYVEGDVYNINLTIDNALNDEGNSKIKVFNSNGSNVDSSHIGALIGRMDGREMSGCGLAHEVCDAEFINVEGAKQYYANYTDVKGIIQTPTQYNYGGLVGLACEPESIDSEGMKIYGKHYYAFTIDMLQNHKYAEGYTKYDYQEDVNGYNVISAIAHYINLSNIEVSASALNDLYDGRPSGIGILDYPISGYDHNPMNDQARGWAKEYTMFKMLARYDKLSVGSGDYIQVIYNAEYVNEVYSNYIKVDKTDVNNITCMTDKIIYTIYQPLGQEARLYCAQGIATQFEARAIDFVDGATHADSWQTDVLKFLFDWDEDGKILFNTVVAEKGQYSPSYGWVEVKIEGDNFTNLYRHFDDGDLKKDTEVTEENKGELTEAFLKKYGFDENHVNNKQKITLGYSYINVNEVMKEHGGYLGEVSVDDKELSGSYFKFDVIYGQGGTLVYNKDEKYSEDDSIAPKYSNYNSSSGSIFEVSGMVEPITIKSVADEEQNHIWKIVMIGLFMLSQNKAGLFMYLHMNIVGRTLGKAIKSLGKYLSSIFKVTLGGTATIAMSVVMTGLEVTGNSFNDITYNSYGGLAHTYSREVKLTNGNDNLLTDDAINIVVNTNIEMADLANELTEGTKLKMVYDKLMESGESTTYLPAALGYISCGNGYLLPEDYGDVVQLSKDELLALLANSGGENNYLYQALVLSGKDKLEIPRYVKINNELYMFPDESKMTKVLYPNYHYVEENSETLGVDMSIDIISRGDCAYRGFENIDDAKTTEYVFWSEEDAKYIKEKYNMSNIAIERKTYTITQGAKPTVDGVKTVKYIDLDISSLYWDENKEPAGTPLDVELEFTKYTTTKPDNNTIFITRTGYFDNDTGEFVGFDNASGLHGKIIYLLPESSGETSLGTSVTTWFTPYRYGGLNTAGFTASTMGISGSYYLSYDSNGPIIKEITYYLYYPEFSLDNDMSGYDWVKYSGNVVIYYTAEGNMESIAVEALKRCWKNGVFYMDDNTTEDNEETGADYCVDVYGTTLADVFKVEGNVLKERVIKEVLKEDMEKNSDDKDYPFIYKLVTENIVNNVKTNAYNKYIYTSSVHTIYTRYIYDENIIEKEFKDGEENTVKVVELLKNEDTVLAESVRITITNSPIYKNGNKLNYSSGSINCQIEYCNPIIPSVD